jgi:acetylornithine deacetylase
MQHTVLAEQAERILATLVGFDTVSSRSNLPLIEWVEAYLKDYNVSFWRTPSPCGIKSNLIVRIGPETGGGIVLSGHTDVVPVEGQTWDTDPFVLTPLGTRLYGRGTSDMKSFLAVCLALVPTWVQQARSTPIYLAFSYDEEVGCLGVPYLVKHLKQSIGATPDFVIIGEPTEMRVVTAHKGVLSFETIVSGKEAHSSQPHLGINAIHIACELVHHLVETNRTIATYGKKDVRFTPSHTTVHVGIIQGGTARNIIAKECKLLWEIRPLPGEDADSIVNNFNELCATFGTTITTTPRSRMLGVSLPAHAQASLHQVMHAAHSNSEHAVSFGTEAGVFNDNGIPAIIIGPGSIDQAHQPNEWIEKSQIAQAVDFLQRVTALAKP